MIHGPDVSSYEPRIDWSLVRTVCDFAIVKVTQGNSYTNPLALDQVLGAARAGLLVMLYHYADPSGPNWIDDAAQEGKRLDDIADLFEQKLGKKIFTFLDMERNTALTPAEKPLWRDWANEFRRWCREEGKRPIGWYSGKVFTAELGLNASWGNTVFWGAAYPKEFRRNCDYGYWLSVVPPWWRADIWQHGGAGPGGNNATCPGIGDSDFNSFAGTRPELEELISVAA